MKFAPLKYLSSMVILLTFCCSSIFGGEIPDSVAGDWHGTLRTPSGELLLIITIEEDPDGALSAEMESPNQAPGRKIPISDISVVENHLSIVLQVIGAKIEADWDDEHQQWKGVFSQGMNLPIVLKAGLPPDRPVIKGLDGDWHATVNRNGVDLRLILHIKTTEHGTQAVVDSPDTMAMGIPISELSKEGDSVGYKIPIVSGVFDGTLTDPDTITGTWALPEQDILNVIFKRSAEADEPIVRNRPQVPHEPFGYFVEEVTFENSLADGVTLAGTLTLPEGEGPFAAAILISGSGPQDRNETVFGHQPFLVLADHLTTQGIAVLRYDDRGSGESTGDYSSATSADFATDANAAFAYLLSRKEIDHDSIGFIGHSEGGLIAPLAITDSKLGRPSDDHIAFMVMLAGPGTSSIQIARSQSRLISLSQGASEEEIDSREGISAQIRQAVAHSSSVEDARNKVREILTPEALEVLGVDESQRDLIIMQNTSPWTRYFLTYDPANYLPKVMCPILALNGELDKQVPAHENLDGLRLLLKDHSDATIRQLSGLNHMFQHAKTGALGEYNDIEETFSPEAMTIISDWINKRFGLNH